VPFLQVFFKSGNGPRSGPRVDLGASDRTTNCVCLQALRETGATGLEPATSGVTGRYGSTGYSRLRPVIAGCSRHFLGSRTGCGRLRPASTRYSLCGRCVVGAVPSSTTIGLRIVLGTLAIVAMTAPASVRVP
jgi:hypothetical protein